VPKQPTQSAPDSLGPGEKQAESGLGGASVEALMRAGAPAESLEEQMALRATEARLFGRAPDPVRFARYVLLERLGEGAAGLVYGAYDPTLERPVAIKLLSAHAESVGRGAERMLAEAQALARLSHPNVVTIFDARAYDEGDVEQLDASSALEVPRSGVFIVMERLHGLTLREWAATHGARLTQAERGRVLAQAGRGLLAAHEVGLVHRDFKPENVFVLDDGQVKVVDFGLATSAGLVAPSSGVRLVSGETTDKAHSVVGTPLYMAPEQHVGEQADARSDQFAFACTAYEVLTGVRAYRGRSPSELAREKSEGQLRWPSGHEVDRRVVQLIEQALQPAPEGRLARLEPLLDALDPRPKRRAWGLLIGALGLAGGLGLASGLMADARAACDDGSSTVDAVWSTSAALRVQQAIEATGLSYAAAANQGVRRGMDAWLIEWHRTRSRSCARFDEGRGDADTTRHKVAGELACLDRRLLDAQAVVGMLERADEDVVRHATSMVDALEAPGGCYDTRAPARAEPLDADRAAAIASARALRLAGKYHDARVRLDELERGVSVRVSDSLGARIYFERAAIDLEEGRLAQSEENFLEALLAAQRARDPEMVVDSWTRLAWVVGAEGGAVAKGRRYVRLADAALAALGEDERRVADLDHTRGGLANKSGDMDAALAHYRRALERFERSLGEHHPAVARTHNHIANVLINQKRWAEARGQAHRSLELRREVFGDTHPLLAASHNNLAVIAKGRGDREAALDHLERARDLSQGVRSSAYGVALQLSGEYLRDYGELDAALGYFRTRARWIEAHMDADHGALERAQAQIGKVEEALARRKSSETGELREKGAP
jgi:tetratricopeptide (TPR) repeat protein